MTVGYSKAHIVWANGDLRRRGVTPDIAIRVPAVQTPEDEVCCGRPSPSRARLNRRNKSDSQILLYWSAVSSYHQMRLTPNPPYQLSAASRSISAAM